LSDKKRISENRISQSVIERHTPTPHPIWDAAASPEAMLPVDELQSRYQHDPSI